MAWSLGFPAKMSLNHCSSSYTAKRNTSETMQEAHCSTDSRALLVQRIQTAAHREPECENKQHTNTVNPSARVIKRLAHDRTPPPTGTFWFSSPATLKAHQCLHKPKAQGEVKHTTFRHEKFFNSSRTGERQFTPDTSTGAYLGHKILLTAPGRILGPRISRRGRRHSALHRALHRCFAPPAPSSTAS